MSWNRVGNGFLPGSFGRNREQYLIGVVEATDGDVLLFQRSLRHPGVGLVANVATRPVGGADPGAEDERCAFRHGVGFAEIYHRVR